MTSMTGYSYKEFSSEDYTLSVEFKSVNSRFLDVSINLPFFLGRLEPMLKEMVTSNIQRGKVDVFIRIKEINTPTNIVIDKSAALAYFNAIKSVAQLCSLDETKIPLSLIVSQEGVLSNQKEIDIERYKNMIMPVFTDAMECFIIDRQREGVNLQKDILLQLEKIKTAHDLFLEFQPKMEAEFKSQITKKFEEVLSDKIDENRIMSEVASMLVKYTINEEIVRLKSHINSLLTEIHENPIPGKKIDFICQEMNREINTIGSKNQFIEVGKQVIVAKDALENIREQTKNVE
ncbi:MAG: YicC/YloC family endoribonuclease [Treponemataceae bacterium]